MASPRIVRVIAIGSHRSVPTSDAPLNPASATPTTEKSTPFSRSVRPSTPTSPFRRRRQNAWVRTTTGRASGTWSSSARKKRPSAAWVPSTSK